ncbi:glycosyltransferase family 4 protein [Geomonas sp. RF6]|uniref:glycosyltransferase family 4 protein n=1 Tax=Geomonas sp. RF6 TaxID=2897342 RepID=UPI001E525815|nr:glycosyltransferase family 4 protein [Geomonas sp. RF6]UFS71083.1 glycosyltransferase family 4 protein [Geomonas sp. RF6]
MGERRESAVKPGGRLDGTTVLRFAHIFKNASGGIEQYLDSLNRTLLERNRMTIVQMHLVREGCRLEVQPEQVGQGVLLWVPSLLSESPTAPRSLKVRVKRALYSAAAATPPVAALLRRVLSRGFLHFDATVSNRLLLQTVRQGRPDLVVFHWVSEDSGEVVHCAREMGIPFLVINHFENRRFNLPLMQKSLAGAAGYGGVSPADVPAPFRPGFLNFSDGIDTDFFSPQGVTSPEDGDVLLLPSRLTPGKGHNDLLRAAALIKRGGRRVKVVFAGREESGSFAAELKGAAARLGLQEETVFTGHLCAAELRRWYGASTVVVLPTLSEGLGRVLLEAQAMERAVVAYDVGGVSCAMENGSTGYLVPKGDHRALARMTELLLVDPERRVTFGRNGRRFVQENFSLPALASRHEDFYLAACAPSPVPEWAFSLPAPPP